MVKRITSLVLVILFLFPIHTLAHSNDKDKSYENSKSWFSYISYKKGDWFDKDYKDKHDYWDDKSWHDNKHGWWDCFWEKCWWWHDGDDKEDDCKKDKKGWGNGDGCYDSKDIWKMWYN